MKKLLLPVLVIAFFAIVAVWHSRSIAGDFDIQEGSGVSGLTIAIKDVAAEIKKASTVGADGIKEIKDAADERGEIRAYGIETRNRLVKQENLMSDVLVMIKGIATSDEEQDFWLKMGFGTGLTAAISSIGALVILVVTMIIKMIDNKNKQ